ncbi:hypothetical protein HHE02_01620 [Helicobacter heilmannii]|nr:hypothetical protein HHE014_14700 [Helicobacter heilmannii]CRF46886.1 hypothetical protein HHE02_01620 [Helicobacter heilmannii]CRF49832.1 hypothetical protein HHE03_15050 [Helicobacter heilmannii]
MAHTTSDLLASQSPQGDCYESYHNGQERAPSFLKYPF